MVALCFQLRQLPNHQLLRSWSRWLLLLLPHLQVTKEMSMKCYAGPDGGWTSGLDAGSYTEQGRQSAANRAIFRDEAHAKLTGTRFVTRRCLPHRCMASLDLDLSRRRRPLVHPAVRLRSRGGDSVFRDKRVCAV